MHGGSSAGELPSHGRGHRFDLSRPPFFLRSGNAGKSARDCAKLSTPRILPPVEGLDLGMDPIRQTSKSGLGQSANEGVIGSLLTPMDRGRGKIAGHAGDGLARISRFFDAEGDIRLVWSRVNQA